MALTMPKQCKDSFFASYNSQILGNIVIFKYKINVGVIIFKKYLKILATDILVFSTNALIFTILA